MGGSNRYLNRFAILNPDQLPVDPGSSLKCNADNLRDAVTSKIMASTTGSVH